MEAGPGGAVTFTLPFTPGPELEEAYERATESKVRTFEVTAQRPWKERLFSLPWRPHHTHRVYTFEGMVTAWEPVEYPGPRAGGLIEVTVTPIEPVVLRRTERRA